MSGEAKFVNPFHRPHCLSAAAPAGKAKLTHPGKAILAGKYTVTRFIDQVESFTAWLVNSETRTEADKERTRCPALFQPGLIAHNSNLTGAFNRTVFHKHQHTLQASTS